MPNVRFIRNELLKMMPRYAVIRDVLGGEDDVKAHDRQAGNQSNTHRYLPMPNETDKSEANRDRYEAYLKRAVFYGVTQRTHQGFVGQIFQKEPTIKLPSALEALRDDVDGTGISLLQQAKKTLGEVLGYGRCGLLVDFPKQPDGKANAGAAGGTIDATGAMVRSASLAEVQAQNLRPTILLFDPMSIVNWRTLTVGAKKTLSLVVISESYLAQDDGFEMKTGDQWRVLSLDPKRDFHYRVGLWRWDPANGDFVEIEFMYPVDAKGQNLTYIPFTFVGSLNNDPLIDLPPMLDMCNLNLAHYRNSADLEEMCFMLGQPTPVVTGLPREWATDVLKGKMQLGSRGVIPLPVGGDAKLLQVSPSTMLKEAMDTKERQMVALGAKLIEQRQVQRTLGEAKLEYSTEISVLGTCSKNVSEAYEKALKWCGGFAGTDEESEVEFEPAFELDRMTFQDHAQLIADWEKKAITTEEMRDALCKGGVAYQDLDVYLAAIKAAKAQEQKDKPAMPPVPVRSQIQENAVGDLSQTQTPAFQVPQSQGMMAKPPG